jgi:hypothetical protein
VGFTLFSLSGFLSTIDQSGVMSGVVDYRTAAVLNYPA